MQKYGVTLVIDVGANVGELGIDLREFGYDGRIVSFEPLTPIYKQLKSACDHDAKWTCFPHALGSERKTVEMNVAANRGQSSSILAMSPTHLEAAPDSNYVDTQEVEQYPLDDLAPEICQPGERIYLKVDVQGYEEQVLAGANQLLQESVVGLQLEVSFVPLYEGGMAWPDAFSWASELGMGLFDIEPVFIHPETQEWLQADVVFFRRDDTSNVSI
jgi:FkbM family methyltransferase